MHKKLIFISDNEELYISFKRAFKCLGNCTLLKYSLLTDGINKNDIFLIDITTTHNNLKQIIDLRLKMCLCPIIVVGFSTNESINLDYYSDFAIWYYGIPILLKELLKTIKYSKPLSKKECILSIINWLSRASHDIIGMLNKPDGISKIIDIINDIFITIKSEVHKNFEGEKEKLIGIIKSSNFDVREKSNRITRFFDKLNLSLKRRRSDG